MKPSALFGVIVRVIGLITTLCAAWHIPFALFNVVTQYKSELRYVEQAQRSILVLLCDILVVVAGLWLLRGAKALVSFAYPNEGQTTEGEHGD